MNPALQKIWDFIRLPMIPTRLIKKLLNRLTPILLFVAGIYRRIVIRNIRFVAVVGSFGKTTTTRCLLTALVGRIHKRHQSGFEGLDSGCLERQAGGHGMTAEAVQQVRALVQECA